MIDVTYLWNATLAERQSGLTLRGNGNEVGESNSWNGNGPAYTSRTSF